MIQPKARVYICCKNKREKGKKKAKIEKSSFHIYRLLPPRARDLPAFGDSNGRRLGHWGSVQQDDRHRRAGAAARPHPEKRHGTGKGTTVLDIFFKGNEGYITLESVQPTRSRGLTQGRRDTRFLLHQKQINPSQDGARLILPSPNVLPCILSANLSSCSIAHYRPRRAAGNRTGN
uniref:Uncharacterized protein n=1 Tax=Oryza sativa subsp. japonica TaxID=39947 RepID=Q6ES04_ORYSJ|nr:hypothetical protein [Oryza sativa Japonica Group]BAD28566.1 hypothetical protein [Oryza sativa Japonica Group]